jgi:hypothetical protein
VANCTLGLNRYLFLGSIGDSISNSYYQLGGWQAAFTTLAVAAGKAAVWVGEFDQGPPAAPATVSGRAFSGRTSARNGWTCGESTLKANYTPPYSLITDLSIHNPQIICVLSGTNNAQGSLVTLETEFTALLACLEDNSPSAARVVVANILPVNEEPHDTTITAANVVMASVMSAAIAGGFSRMVAVDVNAAFKANGSWATAYFTAPEKTHPNTAGDAVIGATFYNACSDILADYVA